MAFTDVEMAILSQLSYVKRPQPSKGETLYSALSDNLEFLKDELGAGYSEALENLMKKVAYKDYVIVKNADDNKGTGFAAIAIKDPDNNVTVACRGTEGVGFDNEDSIRDTLTDLELSYAISTDQQEKMAEFMRELEEDGNYDGYYFTGHSLGGNLANYGAITMVPIDKVKGVVTFNAPGFNDNFMMLYSKQIAIIYNRVVNYQNEYDYVSSLLHVPGPVVILKSALDKGHLGFDDHFMDAMVVAGDGFELRDIQVKRAQAQAAHTVVEYVLHTDECVKTILMVASVIEIGINIGRNAAKAVSKFFESIKNSRTAKVIAQYSSYINVDTELLRSYASRLKSVNRRLDELDKALDKLYWKVGFSDLWDLIKMDMLTADSNKIKKCVKYLEDTATDFESVERTISSKVQ